MKQVSTQRFCSTGRQLSCRATRVSPSEIFHYVCIGNCAARGGRKLGGALPVAPRRDAENGEAWLAV